MAVVAHPLSLPLSCCSSSPSPAPLPFPFPFNFASLSFLPSFFRFLLSFPLSFSLKFSLSFSLSLSLSLSFIPSFLLSLFLSRRLEGTEPPRSLRAPKFVTRLPADPRVKGWADITLGCFTPLSRFLISFFLSILYLSLSVSLSSSVSSSSSAGLEGRASTPSAHEARPVRGPVVRHTAPMKVSPNHPTTILWEITPDRFFRA